MIKKERLLDILIIGVVPIAIVGVLMLLGVFSSGGDSDKHNQDNPDWPVYEKFDTSVEVEVNSPIWLAMESGRLFQGLLDGTIAPEDMYYALLPFTSEAGMDAFINDKQIIINNMKDLVEQLNSMDNVLESTEFSTELHTSENRVSVMRIMHYSARPQFFKQDFILEDGQWKILGDNIQNGFYIR